MSNTQNGKNRRDMIQLLAESIDSQQPAPSTEIDDEQIALLAAGKLDHLNQAQRKRLLRQVASDLIAGELLRDLCELKLEESERAAATNGRRLRVALRLVAAGWAVAACLMVGLLVWRMTNPAAPIRDQVQPYGTEQTQPDYWSQLEHQRLLRQAERYKYREYALLASTTACVILSISLAMCISLQRRRNQQGNSA